MEATITSILGSLLSFLLLYKYAALFVIGYIAALAVPIPSSTTLVAASAFASQGYFSFPLVLLTAFSANVAGDATGYLIARWYGAGFLHRIGLRRVITSKTFAKLEDYILSFPQTVIYFTRFMTEAGPAVNILSGLTKVPYRTYFLFEMLGEASYVLLYGFAGYYLGGEWENNVGFLAKGAMVIVSLGVTLNVAQWALYKSRDKRASRGVK